MGIPRVNLIISLYKVAHDWDYFYKFMLSIHHYHIPYEFMNRIMIWFPIYPSLQNMVAYSSKKW